MLIKENSSILIPIDFSKQSILAIKQTYNLAKFTKCKLILMHADPKSDHDSEVELEQLAITTRQESGLIVETINLKGDVYELNYCVEFFAKEVEIDPANVYSLLTKRSPTPFASFFK